jgi:hypothetical protein
LREKNAIAVLGRNLPAWFRVFYVVNIGFIVLLAAISVFSPASLNDADLTIFALYFLVVLLIIGSVRKKHNALTPEEVSKL